MKYGRCFLLIVALINTTIHPLTDEINHTIPEWENLFDQVGEDQFILEANEGIDIDATRAVISKVDAVANITTAPIQAQKILQNPIYYRSNPPIRRNVIDFPMFQQFVKRGKYGKQFTFKPFYTQTIKEYFYKTRHDINYYIDMNQNELNNQLNDLLTQIEDFDFLPAGFNISNVLGLFTSLYLESRNAGAMFEYVMETPTWTLSGRMPFFYAEHNLNMPAENQEIIQSNPFFNDSSFDEVLFARQHLIADRIGFGDLRINFEHLFINIKKQVFSAGIRATIPTAFAVKKGLYGTSFDVNKPAPQFDLYTDVLLPGLSTPPDQNIPLVQENVQNLGNEIMDRLSTILLESSAGNNHHLGIGIFSHNQMIFSDRLSLSGLLSAEVLLPANERRFFILYTPPAAYNAFDWANTNAQTTQKLNFINQQFINNFFPTGYNVSVFPGLIIQSTSAFTYRGRHFIATVGTDLWWRTPEKFLTVDAPPLVKQELINKETAKTQYGYQSMFWFSFEKNFKSDSSWKFGLRTEVTANSTGVGEEWGLSVLLQKQF